MPVPYMHLHHMVGMHTHACAYAFDRPVCCIAQRQQAAAAPPTHLQHMQPQQPQEGRQPLQVTQRGSVPGCHRVTLCTDLQVATTAQTRCSPCCGSYYLRCCQDPQVTILFKKAQVAHTLSDRQHAACSPTCTTQAAACLALMEDANNNSASKGRCSSRQGRLSSSKPAPCSKPASTQLHMRRHSDAISQLSRLLQALNST